MVQACRRCGQVHDPYGPCGGPATHRTTLVGADEALVGSVVAERYVIGEVLGKGTTGTVFHATHVSFARPAAMKMLRPRYADSDVVSRVFHGEARAAWSVTHPSLCEVFDIGALADGTPFFVMERLEGETLATRIRRERLSVGAGVDVAMQILSAISAIHARDLLLRDLRPQNVFLSFRRGCRPVVKILDFGLARLTPLDRLHAEWEAVRAAAGASDAGGSTAIPYYLSPERARSEHGIEPASDLFVLGIILYESLTGHRPFQGKSLDDVLQQIQGGRPRPLSELRPDVSPDLSQFVMRALSANPRKRPASAKEMQDELRGIFEARRSPTSPMQSMAPPLTPSSGTHAPGAPPAPPTSTPRSGIVAPAAVYATPNAASAPMLSPLARSAGPASPQVAAMKAALLTVDTAPDFRPVGARVVDPPDPYEETQTKRGLSEDAIPNLDAEPLADEDLSTQARRFDIAEFEARVELPKLHGDAYGDPGDEGSTASNRLHSYLHDEASADNTDRTVPPPPPDGIDVAFEEAVDRTIELIDAGLSRLDTPDGLQRKTLGRPPEGAEEEETETMELTPELRARVEQLMTMKPAPREPAPSGPTGREKKR